MTTILQVGVCTGSGTFVSGKATYKNRKTGLPNGTLTGGYTEIQSFEPARFAKVEIMNENSENVIQTGTTENAQILKIKKFGTSSK